MSGRGPDAEEYINRTNAKESEKDKGEPVPVERRKGSLIFDSVPEKPLSEPKSEESPETTNNELDKQDLMEPLYQTLFTGGLDVLEMASENNLEDYSNPVVEHKQHCLNELGLMEDEELTPEGRLVYDNWNSKIERLSSKDRYNMMEEDSTDEQTVIILNQALEDSFDLHSYLKKGDSSMERKFGREYDAEAEFYEIASLFFDDGNRLEEVTSHEYSGELKSRLEDAGLRGILKGEEFNYEGGLIAGGIRLDNLNL